MLNRTLQTLDAASAKLCLNVEKFCRTDLGMKNGKKVLLAISGGADSVALAVIFHILASRLHIELSGMHIDHGLRAASAEDALFVRNMCEELAIPCRIAKLDTISIAKEKSCGLEEAGRIGRYMLLEQYRAELSADFILVAHHAGDLCEDVLMRLIRGCGWPALGGMRASEDRIRRPLLHCSPQSLRMFLRDAEMPWREDESNASHEFFRNRVRHLLIPLLEKENISFRRNTDKLNRMAELDRDYWNSVLDLALAVNPWNMENSGHTLRITLPRALLSPLHPAARLRLYHRAIRYFRGFNENTGQARSDTLFKLESAYVCGSRGTFQFHGGLTAHISAGNIIFECTLSAGNRQ